MNVCFDCRALYRLFDAPSPRVLRERAGMKVILSMLHGGQHRFVLTDILLREIPDNPEQRRRTSLPASLPTHQLFVPGSVQLPADAPKDVPMPSTSFPRHAQTQYSSAPTTIY